MKKTFIYLLISVIFIAAAAFSLVNKSFAVSSRRARLIARGRYIVTGLGKCSDCHTPLNMHGRPVMNKWLQGAVLDMKPIHPVPFWKSKAIDIAGLPKGWTTVETAKFLETGLDPQGKHAGPPMPAYRMKKRDAWAVTYYLLSLKKK
ncbi:MAG: cytochrome C [Deltaproteobacteria bacterium]|nr:cytochrome C [Deltaproteobacteria bacterium]